MSVKTLNVAEDLSSLAPNTGATLPPVEISPLPFITAELPGVGGKIKECCGDFTVEEVPLYEPEGAGEHIYLSLTRENFNTRDLEKALAKLFDLRDRDIGSAGLKDKQARATQVFSLHLPKVDPTDVATKVTERLPVRVNWVKRHKNKLRTGHLLGNQFRIIIREVTENAVEKARRIIEALGERGLPNFYGLQRMGSDNQNVHRGREALLGDGPRAWWLRRFLISAYQAFVFNEWLSARIQRKAFNDLLLGDIAKKVNTGGLFVVKDLEAERLRFRAREITYTGPMYGADMMPTEDAAGEIERVCAEHFHMTSSVLAKAEVKGTRRPALLWIGPVQIEAEASTLTLSFFLPKGAYATIVLREIMKTDITIEGAGDE